MMTFAERHAREEQAKAIEATFELRRTTDRHCSGGNIGKVFDVFIGDTKVGKVFQNFITIEKKRNPTARIVDRRWVSKTPRWRSETVGCAGRSRYDWNTKKAAISSLALDMVIEQDNATSER